MRTIVEHLDLEKLVPGGIDTCISDLVANAPARTIRVVGITADKSRKVGVWTEVSLGEHKVQFFPVAQFDRTRKPGLRVPDSLKFAIGLAKFRRQIRSELVQTHRVETGAICLLLRTGPLIQFIHNNGNALVGKNSDSAWRRIPWAYKLLEGFTLRNARGIVLFNAVDAERLKKIRPDTRVSTTWYDQNVFSTNGGSRNQFAWVARFEAQKDPLLAAETFVELCKIDDTATCVMAGEGSLQAKVREYVQMSGYADRIEFPGRLSRREVAKLLARSRATLLTSHYEGSPRVLFESLACGSPMVATEGADPDRLLSNECNGIRVNRDPALLASKLSQIERLSNEGVSLSVVDYAASSVIPGLLNFKQ